MRPIYRSKKRRNGGTQWRAILNHNVALAKQEEEEGQQIVPVNPSQTIIAQTVAGAVNTRQRALQFNLSAEARAQFVAARPRLPLFQQQSEGVAFMKFREAPGNAVFGARGGTIFMPPRTGKTKLFLTGTHRDVQERVERGEPRYGKPTLLIVPKNVTETMAYENNELFDNDCGLLSRIVLSENTLNGSDVHTIITTHDLIITSYSTIMAFYQRWMKNFGLCDEPGPQLMFGTRWRRVIADEAHRLVNHKNVIFDAVARLQADFYWYVTATPIQNAATDVLSVLKFLRVDKLYVTMQNVPKLLSHLMFRRDYEDLIKINPMFAQLRMPPRTSINRVIDFAEESERVLYRYVEEKSFMHLNSTRALEGPRPPSVFTRDVRPENMALRLRQACVSPWLLPKDFALPAGMRYATQEQDGDLWFRWVHSKLMGTTDAKLAKEGWPGPNVLPPMSTKECEVMDDIRVNVEPRGEKIVVFSEWTSSLDRIHDLLKWRAYIRQGHMDSAPEDGVVCINGYIKGPARKQALEHMWHNPAKYILLVTLQSGGLGEDFTFANHGTLIDPWWTPATEDQALLRLFGIKQARPVTLTVLCIANSVEDYVQARANQKRVYENIVQVPTIAPRQENDQGEAGDDPMSISDHEDQLLADPTEEPTVFDASWMDTFFNQAIEQKRQEQETQREQDAVFYF